MNPHSDTLLTLAREHFNSLPESIASFENEYLTPLVGHALEAIILSAAAVESAVNLEIAPPVTSVHPTKRRPLFAEMAELAYRASVRMKVAFVIKHRQDLQFTKGETKAVHHLFDCRNRIIHPKPEYREYPAESPHTDGLPPEHVEACGSCLSVMSMTGMSSSVINDARSSFEAAEMFLGRLSQRKNRRAKRLEASDAGASQPQP